MFSVKYLSWLTTCTVFIAFVAVLLQAYWSSKHLSKLTIILSNLIRLENSNSSARTLHPRIAVGYGSCSDLYVRATSFLNYTDTEHPGLEFTGEDIANENELLHSFAYYFRNGAASERFTSNQTFFRSLISSTKSSSIHDVRWALGGNAPVMGMRFAREGATVLLAAQMSNRLRQLVPEAITVTGDPIDYDDIHLIMEYKTDEHWGPYTAPRANRYILHNDQNNPTISSLEYLEKQLATFNARLLVVSGLQMLDSYPFAEGIREDRLNKVQQQIMRQPDTTLVHFEMASFVEIKLLHLLMKHIFPYSDSLGMNEQELDNLVHFLRSGSSLFVSESNPRVAQSLNQMRIIFGMINADYFINRMDEPNRRMLTRIHVHTLAYQAILIVKNSQWKNTKNAAAKAALTAHRHVCGTDVINPDASMMILDESFSTTPNLNEQINAPKRILFKPDDPVSCWDETILILSGQQGIDVTICVAPVLVCKVARQTVGAGDNISAAGLILQV